MGTCGEKMSIFDWFRKTVECPTCLNPVVVKFENKNRMIVCFICETPLFEIVVSPGKKDEVVYFVTAKQLEEIKKDFLKI